MKGVITCCFAGLVSERFGAGKWAEVLVASGFDASHRCLPSSDVPDAKVLQMVGNACRILDLTPAQLADAFGEHWVNSYAEKIYAVYFKRFKTAREFILGMDKVHQEVTASIANAQPPRFLFEEVGDRQVNVTYRSARNMILFYMGLVRAVGRRFDTPLVVTRIAPDRVQIDFP